MSALRRFLPEFDAPAPRRAAVPAWRLFDRTPPDVVVADLETDPFMDAVEIEPEPEPEPEQDPVDEAVAAAVAEAETRHAAALAEVETRASDDLAEARARWASTEGTALAEHFGKAVAAAGDAIADAVATLLEPFVGEAIRRSAVEDMRQAVTELITAGTGGRIAVSGPQDLLDALSAALDRSGTNFERLDLTPCDAAEVTITTDSSTVRTRLGDWLQAFRCRLEGEA